MYGDDADNSPTEDTTSLKSTEKNVSLRERPRESDEHRIQQRSAENVPAHLSSVTDVVKPQLKDKAAPGPPTSIQVPTLQNPPSTAITKQNPPTQAPASKTSVRETGEQQIKKQQDQISIAPDKRVNEFRKTISHQVALPTDHHFCMQEKDHLSMACHLFPRLSETNLQFHDISWNYEQFSDNSKRAILRKRMVKVCVLVRILAVRYEKRPANLDPTTTLEVTFCLVDCRPRAENQIISNLYSTTIPLQTGRRSFLSKLPMCSILVRSNYAHKDVKLRVTICQINSNIEVGRVELQLLDEDKKPAWRENSRPHSKLFEDIRMDLEFSEFATRQAQMQADYLPDVLICEESWIGLLACYRQMMCQIIAYHRENLPPTTSINDLVLASFPRIFENKALVNAFIKLLIKERILMNNGTLATGSQPIPAQNIHKFREAYAIYMLPFVKNLFSQDPELLQKDMDTIQTNGALALFAEKKSSPICASDYILHLTGNHALD